MKIVNIILGFVAAGILLIGGYTAGTYIGQTPHNIPLGEWERGWMMGSNDASQGQYVQGNGGRGGMMHSRMMGSNWQNRPIENNMPYAPGNSSTYPTPSASVSFKNDVQPIFAARCVACHGGTSGLSLDTYENVMKGGVYGADINPGDVYNSRLAHFVSSGYMPYGNTPLTSTEVKTVLDWIAEGAPNN